MYTPALHTFPLAPWGARTVLAMALHLASDALARLAHALPPATPPPPPRPDDAPRLEYHAEAGAPEGALFVDGRLVGHLEGVTRL